MLDAGGGGVSGTHVALCSGGMDSTVAAHVATRWGPADLLVYLDTGTGLKENREYVEELADHLGVQLWTLRTHLSFGEWVREYGFPGPGAHTRAYRRLKERQIDKLYSVAERPVHHWTGIRAAESEARFKTAAPVEGDTRRKYRYWHNPIHDWSKADCRRYLDHFDLPRNPLWTVLGRSGDCFCGCFGTREELIDLRAAECDYHAEWLEALEREIDVDDETGRWAWGSLSDTEQRAERARGRDMTLCSACGVEP